METIVHKQNLHTLGVDIPSHVKWWFLRLQLPFMSKNSNVKGISSSSAFPGSQKQKLGNLTEEEIKLRKQTKNIQKTEEGDNTNLWFTSILRTAYSSS